ncbi:hypothetical protein Tco_1073675, partial [Tanacetum coccineum]
GNDDDNDEVTKDDDNDDVDSDADGIKEASDSEKTNSDEDENPNLNQNDDEEEEHEEEYVRTPDGVEFTDDDDEYEELYKDVNGSSSASSDFANQFLNLDNVPPTDTEFVSMMNVKVHHEEPSTQTPPLLNIHIMVIPETLTATGSTIPLTIPPITPLPQESIPTPTPALTTATTITLILALPDFSSLFGFDQRVSALEKELSQFKQADYSAQLLETIKSYTAEFEKKAKDERKRYIDLVEKSVKDIIKDEVKSQLPHILLKEVSDYTTHATASLTEFELKKILLDKIQKSKLYRGAQEHKDLYDALVKSYKLEKDLFKSYEESVFETADTEMPHNQGGDLSNTDDQPNVEETSRNDWFKKPERPSTLDSDWNTTKIIDFRPPQTWISKITKAEKPPLTFDELMSTPIDFSAYNNPEGNEYPFDLSKPLPLIMDQGRQVVPVNYFINTDLEYLKGGSSSMEYTTSTKTTKAAKYDDIQGIEDMVPLLWSLVKVAYDKYNVWGISH